MVGFVMYHVIVSLMPNGLRNIFHKHVTKIMLEVPVPYCATVLEEP